MPNIGAKPGQFFDIGINWLRTSICAGVSLSRLNPAEQLDCSPRLSELSRFRQQDDEFTRQKREKKLSDGRVKGQGSCWMGAPACPR